MNWKFVKFTNGDGGFKICNGFTKNWLKFVNFTSYGMRKGFVKFTKKICKVYKKSFENL